MLEQIQEAARYIQANTTQRAQIGINPGIGLGALAREVIVETPLPYAIIPPSPSPP